MGAVYAATEDVTDRELAVKVLTAGRSAAASRRRFEREARAMMGLSHPNLCQAFDFGTLPSGDLYLVLERLKGYDLSLRLRRDGRLPLRETVRIARDAARGLAAAHLAGLIHRDVKPSNIYLHRAGGPEPVVKVLDFGLAVFTQGDGDRVTRTGEVLGTPAYMAPEQARAQRQEDERTDVYGLGAVLYHALTGRPPFGHGSTVELIIRVLTEDPEPLAALRQGVPEQLAGAVARCLRREPGERTPSMAALLSDLERAGELVADVPDDAPAPSQVVAPAPVTLDSEQRVLTVLLAGGVEHAQAVVDEIRRQGGEATVIGGGKVVGLFGNDVREGDEVGRAVRAALAAGRHCRVVGVGTGRAEGGRGHYSGEVLHAAEQATRVSEAGVTIDAETRARVEGRFALDGHRVLGELTVRGQRRELPLVGREVEVGDISARVGRAFADEEPTCVVVTGPPGIGKSRVATAVRDGVRESTPDVRVVEARCDSSRRFASWWLISAALREIAGLPEDAAPALITRRLGEIGATLGLSDDAPHLLGDVLGVPLPGGVSPVIDAARGDARVRRDQRVGVLGDLIEAATRERPLLMVLEDVHWADSPSLEALEVLVHRLGGVRAAIVLTGRSYAGRERPEIFDNPDFQVVALPELSKRAAQRLLEAVGVGSDVAERIVAHTGGNPLFLEEIARTALTRGGDFSSEKFQMPLTVEEAVQARLDHLDEDDKTLVKCAAVFGVRFWPEGIEALGLDGVGAGLRRLERENLVVRERGPGASRHGHSGGHAFRCGVVRDVAYGMLTRSQAQHLHLLAGRWLARSGASTAVEAAEQLVRGGDEDAALPLWIRAAEEAQRDGNVPVALDCLGRALPAAEGSAEERRIRLMRLSVAAGSGELDVAHLEAEALTDHFAEATPNQLAQYLYWTAAVRQWTGDYAGSRDLFAQAAQAFEMTGDRAGHSRALASEAVQVCTGRLGKARDLARRAVEAAGDDAAARARALHALQYVEGYEGDPRSAQRVAAEALAACEEAGDLSRSVEVMIALAASDLEAGRFEAAGERIQAVLRRSQRIGNRNAEGYAIHNMGVVLLRRGDHERAIAAQTEALELARARRHRRLEGAAQYYIALSLLETGRLAEAAAAAVEGVELTRGSSEEAAARTVRALVHAAGGEVDEGLREIAVARALRGDDVVGELGAELLACEVDLLCAAQRDEEAATRRAEACERLAARARALADTPDAVEAYLRSTPAHRRLIAGTS